MVKSVSLEKDKNIKENITENVRCLFRLKKLKNKQMIPQLKI